jgi:putative multiple sugar transport system ATP-binding protein
MTAKARHRHHPSGTGAGADAVHRREHVPRQRAGTAGIIDWEQGRRARSSELLRKVGLREDPDTLITNIGTGKQQLVEIAKALAKDVKLLILDEPTASLSEKDSQALLDLLLEFKRRA